MRWLAPTARLGDAIVAMGVFALIAPLPLVATLAVALVVLTAIDATRALAARPSVVPPSPPALIVRQRAVPLPSLEVPGATVVQRGTSALAVDGSTLIGRRRGNHELPAPRARVTGPLGLVAWQGPLGPPTTITVLPDVVVGRRIARAVQRSSTYDIEGGRVLGPLGLGTAFEALRPYQPDDDVRLVNWRATSRFGTPIVNQYRLEQSRDVVVALDCGRTALGRRADGHDRLDTLVDAAAAVALTADLVGDRCGLLAFADRPLIERKPSVGAAPDIVRRLAVVEASPTVGDPRTALATIGRKRSIVLVLVDLVDPAAAALLLEAVPVAARRHRVIVVSPLDRDLVDAVALGPTSEHAALRATAAAARLADGELVAQQLRRCGAQVIVAPGASLGAAACRAYLGAGSVRAPASAIAAPM